MLYTDGNNKYEVEFDFSVMLEQIQLKNSARILHAEVFLSNEPTNIKCNHYEIYWTNKIEKDEFGAYQIISSSYEVLTLIVIPQYLDRTNNFKKNNMISGSLDIIECLYSVNVLQEPSEHYTMSYSDGDWNRPFE